MYRIMIFWVCCGSSVRYLMWAAREKTPHYLSSRSIWNCCCNCVCWLLRSWCHPVYIRLSWVFVVNVRGNVCYLSIRYFTAVVSIAVFFVIAIFSWVLTGYPTCSGPKNIFSNKFLIKKTTYFFNRSICHLEELLLILFIEKYYIV